MAGTLLAMRAVVAFVFLWHGVPKAIDPGGAMEKFAGFGLPGLLGPAIGTVEVVAVVLVLGGVWHLWANLVLAGVMIGALLTVQIPNGMSAGLERDLLILTATLLLAVAGPGRYSLHGRASEGAKGARRRARSHGGPGAVGSPGERAEGGGNAAAGHRPTAKTPAGAGGRTE